MCVDCVLTSLRIAQVDPGDEPLPEVVLSHRPRNKLRTAKELLPDQFFGHSFGLSPASLTRRRMHRPISAPS
jgi:hypothetical protein